MIRKTITTESGAKYRIYDNEFWTKNDGQANRLFQFYRVGNDVASWDEVRSYSEAGEPIVGMRMYIGDGRMTGESWISTQVVDIVVEEVDEEAH